MSILVIPWSVAQASHVALVVKNLPPNAGDIKRPESDPWDGKIPWRRAWQPSPVFLPGESPGQSSLVGYGPDAQSDMIEATACKLGL